MAESEAETPSTPGEFESKYFEFHGVRLPPFCRGKMEEISNFPVRPSDVWIVTYPKSGEPRPVAGSRPAGRGQRAGGETEARGPGSGPARAEDGPRAATHPASPPESGGCVTLGGSLNLSVSEPGPALGERSVLVMIRGEGPKEQTPFPRGLGWGRDQLWPQCLPGAVPPFTVPSFRRDPGHPHFPVLTDVSVHSYHVWWRQ